MTSLTGPFAKFAALVCLGLASLSANALEMRGFRGIAWGDGAQSLGPASVDQVRGDVVCYKRERENMFFGDNPIGAVRYCFHQDRFFMVSLDSTVGPKALMSEFQRTYGPPKALARKLASWGSESSNARAEIVALSAGGVASRLSIYSNKFEPTSAKVAPADVPRRIAAAL